MEPLLTQITGRWPKRHYVWWTQEAISSSRGSLGSDWYHCQRETGDPTASPDDDSCMVLTPWGKVRENKASASILSASLPEIWGENGSVQETPTHCFASFISPCVNSLVDYACATVFVLLIPQLTSALWCFDRLFQNLIKPMYCFWVRQPIGQQELDGMLHWKANKCAESKFIQTWRRFAATVPSGNTERCSRVRPCVWDFADKKKVLKNVMCYKNSCSGFEQRAHKWKFSSRETKSLSLFEWLANIDLPRV